MFVSNLGVDIVVTPKLPYLGEKLMRILGTRFRCCLISKQEFRKHVAAKATPKDSGVSVSFLWCVCINTYMHVYSINVCVCVDNYSYLYIII